MITSDGTARLDRILHTDAAIALILDRFDTVVLPRCVAGRRLPDPDRADSRRRPPCGRERVPLRYERPFGCAGAQHRGSQFEICAPSGLAGLISLTIRASLFLLSREVCDAKAVRWRAEWPLLTVLPWHGCPACAPV